MTTLEDKHSVICPLCNSDKIHTQYDVGFDIDTTGEERQHIDTCTKCGAWRLHIDRIENFKPPIKNFEEWKNKSEEYFS